MVLCAVKVSINSDIQKKTTPPIRTHSHDLCIADTVVTFQKSGLILGPRLRDESERSLRKVRSSRYLRRTMNFGTQVPVNGSLDSCFLVGVRLVLPRSESKSLASFADVVGTSHKHELHPLNFQHLGSQFSPAGSPDKPFGKVRHEHYNWRWDHPDAAEWSLVPSENPVFSKESPGLIRLVVSNVESLSINLRALGSDMTAKKPTGSLNLCFCDMSNVDDIHIDIVVSHPNVGLAILESSDDWLNHLEIAFSVQCRGSNRRGIYTCTRSELVYVWYLEV